MKTVEIKDLNYYKDNAEEDYPTTPISVLRYITELEKEVERLRGEQLTAGDIKFLKSLRAYFGEHDKTLFEHNAYSNIDAIIKKLATTKDIKNS